MIWYYLIIFFLITYLTFFGFWIFLFHKEIKKKNMQKKKMYIVFITVFLLITCLLSFIMLKIPY